MPDELYSPIKLHLVQYRMDPEWGHSALLQLRDRESLFGTLRLARNWGRIGTKGQELVKVFDTVRYPWRPRRGASPRTCHRPL
jgi:hypothetical protein